MRGEQGRRAPFKRIVYTVLISPAESAALNVLAELEEDGAEDSF